MNKLTLRSVTTGCPSTMPRLIPIAMACVLSSVCLAQPLSSRWEELTSEEFVNAVKKADGVCILPFGILEKHGPSGPLGTDPINIRHIVLEGLKKEYALVFPEY